MTDAQALIREAQDKAERLCALAVEQTPAGYQSFITLIEQRKLVDLDVCGDDKLLARQPDAVVRNERKRERLLGVADVNHHFRLRPH